jgi:ComF family protein
MDIPPLLAAISAHALSILAPPRCAACDARIAVRAIFCAPCAATVRADEPARSSDPLAAFVYGGAIATAITRFKYERRPDLARPIAHLLMRATSTLAADPPDVVLPVPLHPTRLADRGFNQATLLARPVASQLLARFVPLALARTRDTPHQAHLDRAARAENVAGAFRVRRDVRDLRVLLVDDVVTTGATLRACADVLRRAGARDVRAAVVARAE